jgi:hypothetical protein
MKKLFLFTGIFVLISTLTLTAQVTIGKNQTPDPAAVLDLQSNDRLGLLLPRVALTDTLVATPLAAHVQGMFVYNTTPDADGKMVEGIYYNDGNRWWLVNSGNTQSWQVSGTTDAATENEQNIYQMGRVTIGCPLVVPNPIVKLNVVSNNKGIMIPRMSQAERDAIDIPNHASANSLLIYNTDEDCYNYYSRLEEGWQSLCGKLGKAQFDISDCSSIQVFGQYLTGSALGTAQHIKVTVEVTKAGSYSITAMSVPDNGYYFSASGEFLTTGTYEVILQGAGTPRDFTPAGETGDPIAFDLNGIASSCNNIFIKVEDSSIQPIYSMICNTVKANGVYQVNVPLDGSTHTITLQLNVDPAATGATYFIETNTIDGIRFAGSGILMGGLQTVTLQGSGRPTSYDTKRFTITNNSVSDVESCFADITIAYSRKTILSIGSAANGYGYNFSGNSLSNTLLTTQSNFGLLENSAVKIAGIEFIRTGDFLPTAATLQAELNKKPDIVIVGYSWGPTDEAARILVDYVAQGGVLLAFMEGGGPDRLLQNIFGQTTITSTSVNAAGAVYQLPFVNDEVLNGPFGDIRGMQWGEDASATAAISNLPEGQITVYSYGTDISGSTSSGASERITAFRHNTLNLIFVGDGGFNSGLSGNSSSTICPFALDSNNRPTFKPNYGRATANRYDVYNAVFTANALAWAIKQAQFNGINK